jgi:Skp family chaperone for outer membrane proteins
VKSCIRWATTLAAIIGWVASAQAQFAPPAGAPAAAPAAAPIPQRQAATGGIALLDVGAVFDKHARFQAEMNAMKAEVKQFEDYLRTAQQGMQAKAEKLKQYQPGTEPYKKVEEELLVDGNNLKTQTQIKRKEFLEREADAYFRVYREIESVVAYHCSRNGTLLVLRYSNQDINQKDRDSVLRGINRPIVFRQPYLDITDAILAQLNPRGTVGPVPPTGGPGVNPNGGTTDRRTFIPGPPRG